MRNKLSYKLSVIHLVILFTVFLFGQQALAKQKFLNNIQIKSGARYISEKFYSNLSDVANSPLVECSYLLDNNYILFFKLKMLYK
jgi:hypothetical protein